MSRKNTRGLPVVQEKGTTKDSYPFLGNNIAFGIKRPDGPRRGHMYVTAGLDPRWMTSPQTPDPKGVAHQPCIKQTSWHFRLPCDPFGDEGICQSPDLRGSRPGFFLRFATKAAKPSDAHETPLGSYCRVSLCHLIYYSKIGLWVE